MLMLILNVVYVLVALAAVGAMAYTVFGQSAEPLALILRELGHGTAAAAIGIAMLLISFAVLLCLNLAQRWLRRGRR